MNNAFIQYFIFASVLVYFVWEHFDQKKLKDEREEFIRLKTYELTHKVTLYTVLFLAFGYVLYPPMPVFVALVMIVLGSLYSEILGKFYFRRKY
jgi:hypothetical protein